jgi:hypothetical protein
VPGVGFTDEAGRGGGGEAASSGAGEKDKKGKKDKQTPRLAGACERQARGFLGGCAAWAAV